MRKNIICIVLFFLIVILINNTFSYATEKINYNQGDKEKVIEITKVAEDRKQTIDQTIQGADDFISGADTSNTIDEKALKENIDLIYNILLGIGMIVAVACGIALGIKFMYGSLESQAEVKEKLIPYVIGCFVIFGAFGIWKIVINVMQTFN